MNVKEKKEHSAKIRQDIMEYMKQYIQQHGYPPSRKEIGECVGLRAKSSVKSHIDRMLADGMLETDAGAASSRALRVPGMQIVSREMTVLDRYMESERIRIVEQLCPYDIPWLVREMGEERLMDKNCMNECEQCWKLPLKPGNGGCGDD